MKYFKEILNKIKHKNDTTSVGASIARPHFEGKTRKTILITLPILLLLIVALIAIGITNAANSTTEPETEQTFTEDGDGYYIWVRAVDHAGNKGPWSEAQRVWIDATGPSAPTITGGSSEYALSRTISVSTASDDNGASGVAYYEYCKKSGADKPDTTADGTKVTTSETSQEFNINIAGEYVFFRAVDVVGNKGAWSDGQQVYIDVNAPKITVKNSSVEVSKGDTTAFSTYFTVDANGTNTSVTTTYTINGTKYDNPSSLEPNTYTVTCTATKTGGNSASETMTLKVKTAGISAAQVAAAASTYYGKEIKGYTCTNSAGINKWLIFHSDGTNIYMISDDYITYNYMPPTRTGTVMANNGDTEYCIYFPDFYSNYSTKSADVLNTAYTDERILKWIDYASSSYGISNTEENMQCVSYLLDSKSWSAKFGNSTYADYAIGGPTVELFAESYNKLYSLNIGYSHEYAYGYKVGTEGASGGYIINGLDASNPLYINDTSSDRAYGYWLASPSNRGPGARYLIGVNYYGTLMYYTYYGSDKGLRPLVCLSSGVQLTDNGDGTYGLTL